MHRDPTATDAIAALDPADDDAPAALLLAALVEAARRDASRGDPQARAWLAEWVEQPARELLARGGAGVRLAA